MESGSARVTCREERFKLHQVDLYGERFSYVLVTGLSDEDD